MKQNDYVQKINVTATLRQMTKGQTLKFPLDRQPVSGIKTAVKRLRKEGKNFSVSYRGNPFTTVTCTDDD